MGGEEGGAVDLAADGDGEAVEEAVGAGEHVVVEVGGEFGVQRRDEGLFLVVCQELVVDEERDEPALVRQARFAVPFLPGRRGGRDDGEVDEPALADVRRFEVDAVFDLAEVEAEPAQLELAVAGDAAVELELAVGSEAAAIARAEAAGPAAGGVGVGGEGVGGEGVGGGVRAVEVAGADLGAADADLADEAGGEGLHLGVEDVVAAVGQGEADGDVGRGGRRVGDLVDGGLDDQLAWAPGVVGDGGGFEVVEGSRQANG